MEEYNVKNIKKLMYSIRDVENENIQQALKLVSREFNEIPGTSDGVVKMKGKYHMAEERLEYLIEKENELFPRIEDILLKVENNEEDAYVEYQGISNPVNELIIYQRNSLEYMEEIKAWCYNLSFFLAGDYKFRKLLADLFDLCQLFEKHIFIEEHLFLPSLVRLLEEEKETVEVYRPQHK